MDRQTADEKLHSKIKKELLRGMISNNIKLPRGFYFTEEGNRLTMTFSAPKGVGLAEKPDNMQNNAAAFEGWAAALYVHYLHKNGMICLNVNFDLPPQQKEDKPYELYKKYPHYSRFLYRALRFSQQYAGWFCLSDNLSPQVASFERYLNNNRFVNNVPKGEAGINQNLERIIENRFAEEPALLEQWIGKGNKLHRQLPTGLFQESVADKNRIFPSRTSAIDLWALDHDTLKVIELKANNKMMGALTELFFYTNYVNDMFVDAESSFKPTAPSAASSRGYACLFECPESGRLRKIKKTAGYLLLDRQSCHPLIDTEVLDVLSGGKNGISYERIIYVNRLRGYKNE